MNILYASDDNYAPILGISILSLLENNQNVEKIYVYIINDNISEENRIKIESIFQKYEREPPVWKTIKGIKEALHMDVYTDRFSQTQYARFFLEDIVNRDDERILYFDCDTIICGSLEQFFHMSLQGKVGGVCADAFSSLYRKNIGLNKTDIIFNSGVMLIDMIRWREEQIGFQLEDFIRLHNGVVQQGDQGVLNAVLNGKVYIFPPQYNFLTNYSAFSYKEMILFRKPVSIYSENEIEEARKKPCVIHYTSSFLVARPWEKGRPHPYKEVWDQYKVKSPWKQEEIYQERRMKKWEKIYIRLVEKAPYRLALCLSGILQAYIRPVLGRIKYNWR